jgi:predicted flavoprotein YhiN
MLKELVPIQIIKPFISYCGINVTKKCYQINKIDREKFLNGFFDFRIKILKTKDLENAEVARGGVITDKINHLVKGLYFCREIINIDAPTGGFNLQAAFSTGYLAGNSIGG